jgi:hypothetical protein
MLLACASPLPDEPRIRELARSVDWLRLVDQAEEHGVVGHLAVRVYALGENLLPREVKRLLLERQRAQLFSTMTMTAELFRLLALFRTKDIPALVVKGPVLAMEAYGDPAIRSYVDLDLLVRQQDIRHATESLEATGYRAVVPLGAIDAGKIPGQYLFTRPEQRLSIELHNDFTLRYFPRRLPIEDFFARQIRVPIDGHEVPALSVEDELVVVCIHGAKHFWEKLMWIADVAGLVSRQRDIDWGRATASARAVGAEHLLHTGLRLATDLLDAELPAEVSALVGRDGVAGKLVSGILRWLPAAGYAPRGLFERAAFRLRMRGGGFAGPAYLLRLSLSPTEEDWQTGDGISHNRLFDMLRRPFRLARKYGRGSKS